MGNTIEIYNCWIGCFTFGLKFKEVVIQQCCENVNHSLKTLCKIVKPNLLYKKCAASIDLASTYMFDIFLR